MSTALIVTIAIAAVLIGFLAFVASRPATFRIQRSAVIKARAETVFGYIDDFNRWAAWSPWEQLDPDMKRGYAGSASGKGAVYTWEGAKAGSGRMEILEAPAPSKVLIKLDFLKPFPAKNTAEFTLAPDGSGTRVEWAMYGPRPFMVKLMGLFFDMDKVVGADFEKGLAALKGAAEAA
jgi:hypothetical protein